MKQILFLCTGNSCRSQMAEHLARKFSECIAVRSAGTDPQNVHPLAVSVMEERGVDMSSAKSKALEPQDLTEVDMVITLCGDAQESCPVLPPGVQRRHWPLNDPARAQGTQEEKMKVFRQVRDQICERVRKMLEELHDSPSGKQSGNC